MVRQRERFCSRASYATATTSAALLPSTTDLEALGAIWPLMNSLEGTMGRDQVVKRGGFKTNFGAREEKPGAGGGT